MKAKYIVALLAFVFIILFPIFLNAQTETGSISGIVTDPSGAVVPGATITITSVEKQNTRSVTSGAKGEYIVTNLEPGNYDVTIEHPGFGRFKRRVQVTVAGRQPVDAKLSVAGTGTTVEVQAEGGAQVNTEDQTISQVVTGTQVRELPTITRDPYDLVQLSGNVATSEASNNANAVRGVGGFSLNGQRATSTDILLDGGENVDEYNANLGVTVPLDSVEEFRVLTSSFTAEYGRASGGVVNVATRSGSNDIHGSLYEFNRISRFAANSYQNLATGQPRDHFVRNQFGYAVGGPIVKNKLFFFQSTEWHRVRGSLNNQAYIPTPQFLASAAPNTQAFFNAEGKLRPGDRITQTVTLGQATGGAHPIINTPGPLLAALPASTPIFDLVNFSTAQDAGGGDPQNRYFGMIRIDYNITDKTQLYGRYAGDHDIFFPGFVSTSPYNGFETTQKTLNQNALLNLTHIFSSSTVSQTKVDYNRFNLFQPLGTAGVVPGVAPRGTVPVSLNGINMLFPGYLPLSPGSALPFGGPQNLYQANEDVTINKGAHSFKLGGQYIQTRDNRTFGAFETGFYTLSRNGSASSSLDSLLAGNVFQFQGAVNPQGKFPCVVDPVTNKPITTPSCLVSLPVVPPSFTRNNLFNDAAAYVQDTWKVVPRFTANIGLRWDYFGVQRNRNRALDSNFYFGPGATPFQQIENGFVATTPQAPNHKLWSPQWRNFEPRVGFAYDLFGDGRSSLRGGYGISYERNFGNVTFNVIQNPPAYAVISLRSPGDVTTPIPLSTSNFGPLGAPAGTAPLLRTSLRAVNPSIKTAYAHFYSLSFEHEVVRNTVFALEYAGSRGLHQYSISDISPLGSGVVFGGLDPSVVVPTSRLNHQYSNINFRGSNGDSYYNGLNVRVDSKNFQNYGLSLTANYTWSHAIDDLSSTFSESSNNFNLGFLSPFNPRLDRGNADFDVRHRVVVSALYEVPFPKNSNGFVQQVFGGWEAAPIFNAQTGTPFTVFDATNSQEQTPRYAPLGTITDFQGSDHPRGTDPNVFSYLVLPPRQDFSNPVLGFSDLGPFPANMTSRNTFRGPNHWWLDFGLYKNFKLTERVGLQLRGEAYNIANHPNLWVVGSSADPSTSFADIGTAGCPAVAGAVAGTNVCPVVQAKKGGLAGVLSPATNTHEHRNMQFAIKLNF
ncbi:MAG TPA: carboxypeptidase regulatory-like domain-containing protein [Terriglobales bacterium]|nr:carboxypeptidase regulatory-like domain-containing protein [Terriglobales bacterium]